MHSITEKLMTSSHYSSLTSFARQQGSYKLIREYLEEQGINCKVFDSLYNGWISELVLELKKVKAFTQSDLEAELAKIK